MNGPPPSALVDDVRELEASTRLFLDQHAAALAGEGAGADRGAAAVRARAACDGLLEAMEGALPAALDELRARLPRSRGPSGGVGSGDLVLPPESWTPAAREAFAHAALRKRMAEVEGALLHLRLALARRDGAAPAGPAAALDALAGLRAVLALWAGAAIERATGGPAPAGAPPEPGALLHLARQCLQSGAADAAGALLRRALAAALSAPLPPPRPADVDEALSRWAEAGAAPRGVDLDTCRGAVERLARLGADDVLAGWVLLDLVERAASAAATTPPPGAGPADGASAMRDA